MSINASICNLCNRAIVPPREICPYCGPGVKAMTPITLDGKGEILSHTTLYMTPEGFESPLHLALIGLDHGAVVLSHALGKSDADIKIGDKVKVQIGDDKLLYYTKI